MQNIQTSTHHEWSAQESKLLGYTGVDVLLYRTLSDWGKKAYIIAAKLHDNVKRKDGSWYLDHINRSLHFFQSQFWLWTFGNKFDRHGLERDIILHDCAEDHEDGISEIERTFWDKVLKKTLWMSEMNANIRRVLPAFVANLPENRQKNYALFIELIRIIEENYPDERDNQDNLGTLFPNWDKDGIWKKMYASRYENEPDIEKQKDIIADYVFQWMVTCMPEDCFLAKSAERYDNLSSREWLKNIEWISSYNRTLATTSQSYLPRLVKSWYDWLANIILEESWQGMREMTDVAKKITNAL